MRRQMIGVLTVALIGLLSFNWWRAEARATGEGVGATAPFDWSTVSSRDLNIAAVFLTARDLGVTRAIDSLKALTETDSTLRGEAHMIAHALGRFAIANNKHDPSVLAQCRPAFQAGCYHGVLEGYLSSLPHVDPAATSRLCAALETPGSSRSPALECAHGLGHGFIEALRYDLQAALVACDAFTGSELRRECHDGVFMENTVHGLGMPTMNVGDSAMGAHMHMMASAAPTRAAFRPSDLKFPCDSVGEPYQPSCWAYQPLVIARLSQYDFPKTLQACATASASSQASCYQGFGKQSMAWFNWNEQRVINTCRGAGAHTRECLAGGVEALVDLTMTADRAIKFCDATPEDVRTSCFGNIGTRISRIGADSSFVAHNCALAGKSAYVHACVAASTGDRGRE